MASTGVQWEHINHINTQLPYVLVACGVSFVGFVLAGFIQSALIVLPICIVLLIAVLFIMRGLQRRKA